LLCFASRRRHTRLVSDWSSDVCSSDLGPLAALIATPRAQNPTGSALDEARAAELREVLAERPDLLVIEDDHAGPVAGAPAHTLRSEERRVGKGGGERGWP